MELTVNQIASVLNGSIEGDGSILINSLAKIQDATTGQLSFLANQKYATHIYSTGASAVIVDKAFKPDKPLNTTLIRILDPYAGFTTLLDEYVKSTAIHKVGIEEPVFTDKDSTQGEHGYRGAFSYVGSGCRIGKNVKIYPQVYVGDSCTILDNTIIFAGVKLYSGTQIGQNCIVHAGSVLGSDGFGFAPQEDGGYKTIPQFGHVIVEDNVSIGANTVIDCATFPNDATTIKQGTKLDNLIQIAHNVVIGKNTVIAAQAGISGSTEVGDNCLIAGQVGLVGHLKIHNNTTIAAQSGISKSTINEGETLFGYPAYDIKSYMNSYAIFKKLPDLYRRLNQLEKK